MDIYFCDECGARVTDLDLRAGKGMRQRHDTICSACVDQGRANEWLARTGQAVGAAQAQGASLSSRSASLAVAEPDPISIARDRARTVPDDPFQVDEPQPLKPVPSSGVETDAIPAKPRPQAPPAPAPAEPDLDSLAAASSGFGALGGSQTPPPVPVDEPDERSVEVADAPGESAGKTAEPGAAAESPFDFVHPKDNDNPGKAETSEIEAVGGKDETKAAAKPTRSQSGRNPAQKRSGTSTSKRTPVKPASTRRSGVARRPGNKVILFSLLSCGLMLLIFIFAVVVPKMNRGGGGGATQVTEEPYQRLKEAVDRAKVACGKALQADDMPTISAALASGEEMMRAMEAFERAASKRGWKEEEMGEALRLLSYPEVQSMMVQVRKRKTIVDSRK